MKIRTVILAGGLGTRMKSDTPKVLHQAAGRAMVEWAIEAVTPVDAQPILVVGESGEAVKAHVGDRVQYAYQEQPLGTGDAVMAARSLFSDAEYVVITCGDMPLLRAQSIEQLTDAVKNSDVAAAVLTANMDNPQGMGRIVRGSTGQVQAIIEHADASEVQKEIQEVNTGVFCFHREALEYALDRLANRNMQEEYYLTQAVEILTERGDCVHAVQCSAEEAMGTNDRRQLAQAAKVLRRRINDHWMLEGVTLIDPDNTYIDGDVTIGSDTVIYPGCVIEGQSTIGRNCTIYGSSVIQNSHIYDHVHIMASTMVNAQVGSHTHVGPNAYLRPGAVVGEHCKIGDFVEIKNANIGDDTKISHLTYVGDADVGKNVNLGCGVVFVNYDGVRKHRTTVHDNAFIGCNTNLVSPVTVGENAYTAAGSTITEDVPADALGIARQRQVNKGGWAAKRKK